MGRIAAGENREKSEGKCFLHKSFSSRGEFSWMMFSRSSLLWTFFLFSILSNRKNGRRESLKLNFFMTISQSNGKKTFVCEESAENCLLSIKRREGKSLKGEKNSIALALFSGAVCEMTLARRLKSAEPDYEIDSALDEEFKIPRSFSHWIKLKAEEEKWICCETFLHRFNTVFRYRPRLFTCKF